MKLESLIRNLKEINSSDSFEVKEEILYNSKFLKENTILNTYEEFKSKFNINEEIIINSLNKELKDKIIKSISDFNNWQEFYDKALSNFGVNKVLKD